MKIKTSKILVTWCLVVAMVISIVPMFALTVVAADETFTYDFSKFSGSSTQYANETHTLSDKVTLIMSGCHINTQLRIYGSKSTEYATFKVAEGNYIKSVTINVGNKADTLNVSASTDGKTWDKIGTISTTSSYADKTVTISGAETKQYTQIKFEVSGTQQVRVKTISITMSQAAGDPDCEHTSSVLDTENSYEATKTTAGKNIYVCEECGAKTREEDIPALGCNVTFVVPTGVKTPAELADVLTATMPEADLPEGSYAQKYEFAGWAVASVDSDTTVRPTLYSAGDTVTLTGDTTFYAVYSYDVTTGEGEGNIEWVKKDEINAGDTVVITVIHSNGTKYAMSNDKGTSAAPSAIIVNIDGDKITSEIQDNMKWTVSGDINGLTFHPNEDTSKWLYCFNDNNGVRVGDNDNKTFVIDATSGYLKHVGTSRYLGVYATTPDWRCYTSASGQNIKDQELGFYVAQQSNVTTYYTSEIATATPAPTPDPAGEISSAAMILGKDLSVLYNVTLAKGEVYDDFTMKFVLNGEVVEATTKTGIFELRGVAPHMMGDVITATLYKNGEEVDVREFRIKDYLTTIINSEDPDITEDHKKLAKDLLIYGAASQKHNHTTDSLVTTDTPVVDETDKPESDLKLTQVAEYIEGVSFSMVGVHFNYVNKLFAQVITTEDVEISVKVNGKDVEIVDGFVYTSAISPKSFATKYTFELYVNGELYQTLVYSVNSYISARWDAETGLAKALYNYAQSFNNVNN